MTEIGLECEKGSERLVLLEDGWANDVGNWQHTEVRQDGQEGREWVIVNADIDQALIQENPSWIK